MNTYYGRRIAGKWRHIGRQIDTYGRQMNIIRRDSWIRMGDILRYMGADGNIEAQREHECPEGNK
jgi:hypothetical protein